MFVLENGVRKCQKMVKNVLLRKKHLLTSVFFFFFLFFIKSLKLTVSNVSVAHQYRHPVVVQRWSSVLHRFDPSREEEEGEYACVDKK